MLVAPGSSVALTERIDALFGRDPAIFGRQARANVCRRDDYDLNVPHILGHYGSLFASLQRANPKARLADAYR